MTRQRVHDLLEGEGRGGRWLNLAIHAVILVAAVAIAVETMPGIPAALRDVLAGLQIVVLVLFAVEYAARLYSAENRLSYAFSFWGVIDLLAILPLLAIFSQDAVVLRTLRLIRLVWVLKIVRLSRAFDRMQRAFVATREELGVFFMLALLILFIASVGIYTFEHEAQPEVFTSIPASFWWAVVSFTTVGYGDMVPITLGGRVFATIILFIGLGVVAVPAAILSASLINLDRLERLEQIITEEDPDAASGPEFAHSQTEKSETDRRD